MSLVNTIWRLNNTIDLTNFPTWETTEDSTFNLDITLGDGSSYPVLAVYYSTEQSILYMNVENGTAEEPIHGKTIYNENYTWYQASYKTWKITGGSDADNPKLEAWLKANAIQGRDLTGTEWVFNTSVGWDYMPGSWDLDYGGVTAYLNFTSNGTNFTSIYHRADWYTQYGSTTVYTYGWYNTAYRTIKITGGTHATDPEFALWLEANATEIIPTFTVTFNRNGHGTAPSSQSVKRGNKATRPTDPTASGYVFSGWYTESTCINEFDFNQQEVQETYHHTL